MNPAKSSREPVLASDLSSSPIGLELVTGSGSIGQTETLLGVISPSNSLPVLPADLPSVELPIGPLGTPRSELWKSPAPLQRIERESVHASVSPDLLFGIARTTLEGDLQDRTFELFSKILALAAEQGRPHLVRAWNYFPRINVLEGLERYRLFCIGRYDAYEAAGFDMNRDLPAGSAVGASSGDLIVSFVASRHRPRFIENPRQMSAFRYPERYGPRSPSFARAALLDDGKTLFISGTASIVGHESVHIDSIEGQLEETIRNLDAVVREAFGGHSSLSSPELDCRLRAYIRRENDLELVSSRLARLVPETNISCLHADICRRELLVEIEAFVRKTG